jgi:peptidoglycan/LPS O-acetylase OafA/YrhL
MQLSNLLDVKDNNFNVIRLLLALLVIFSHTYAVFYGFGATTPFKNLSGFTLGDFSVNSFFIISGFLISISFYRSKSWVDFLFSRLLRIFPAAIFSSLISVFVIGGIFTELPLSEYLYSHETLTFLIKNSILLFGVEYDLPGVFLHVPYENVINGSLWTLPYELKLYIILFLFLSTTSLFDKLIPEVNIKLFFCFGAYLFFVTCLSIDKFYFITPVATRLLCFFFCGVLFNVASKYIWLNKKIFTLASFFVIFKFNCDYSLLNYLYVPSLCYIILFIVYIPKRSWLKFNKMGDYSYGMYIYAFPIQQTLIFIFPDMSFLLLMLCSFIFTFILSFFSWHFVESVCIGYRTIITKKIKSVFNVV